MKPCEQCVMCDNPVLYCKHIPVFEIYFNRDNITSEEFEVLEDAVRDVLSSLGYSGRIEDRATGNTTRMEVNYAN